MVSSRSANLAKGRISDAGGRPSELDLLEPFIGRWITEGGTAADGDGRSNLILCSDVYEWAVGRRLVIHPVHGRVGETPVSGLEVIRFDSAAGHFRTQFYDSFGNVSEQTLSFDGSDWLWQGPYARCTGTFSADGRTLVARHERSEDGRNWQESMLVNIQRTD